MEFDLDDPALLFRDDVVADPGPLYDDLRRRAPVWRIPGQDSYLVADPDLIRDAVARTEEFSSNLVSLVHQNTDGGPASFELAPFADAVHVLATADPPVHTRHRKLLQSHLSPAAVAWLEPELRPVVDAQLAPMLATGRGDAVTSLSDPVPALAICRVVGVPPEDAPQVVRQVADIGLMLDGVVGLDDVARAAGAALELAVYVRAKLDEMRARPAAERDGMLAVLAGAIDEGSLTAEESEAILMQVFNAGTETTSSLIATTVEALARDDAFQARLRSDPEGIPAALEELLREDGPFQFHYRWTTTDTVLGGEVIPAHSRVLLLWAAANRASATGSDGPGPHYAFGRGIHFCIGAPLARLEARVTIEQLLARTSGFTLDPAEPPRRRPSVFLRRHAALPLVVEPA